METLVFIRIKEVQILLGCNQYNTALRHHKAARKALHKKSKYLTVKEFCNFMDMNYEQVLEYIKMIREKSSR